MGVKVFTTSLNIVNQLKLKPNYTIDQGAIDISV